MNIAFSIKVATDVSPVRNTWRGGADSPSNRLRCSGSSSGAMIALSPSNADNDTTGLSACRMDAIRPQDDRRTKRFGGSLPSSTPSYIRRRGNAHSPMTGMVIPPQPECSFPLDRHHPPEVRRAGRGVGGRGSVLQLQAFQSFSIVPPCCLDLGVAGNYSRNCGDETAE